MHATARPRRWTALLPALLCLLLAQAKAQTDTYMYQSPDYVFSFAYPSGWQAAENMDPGGGLMVTFEAPGDVGGILFLAQAIGPTELANVQQTPRGTLNAQMWDGFSGEVPGAQMLGSREITVAGLQAAAIDYGGAEASGTIVYFLQGSALYTLAYASTQAGLPMVRPAFETLLATLNVGGASSTPAAPALNPFPATPAAANPLAPQPPVANPLAPADPFVGTFSDGQISLTLRGGPSQYEGQISSGGQVYPVVAQASGAMLSGSFLSGGTSFPFSATLSGSMLDFETGGARYQLSK